MTRTSARGLTFNEARHIYRLDGKHVPGVTTINRVLDKSGPLTTWAAERVARHVAENPASVDALRSLGVEPMVKALREVPREQQKQAADRGTDFHDYAQRIMLGEQVDVPEEQVPLVESALDFMDAWDIRPVLVEQAVGSRQHWYAGTADLVADHNHGPRAIFDWKTGKRIYTTCAWQLVAYANAEFYGLDGDEKPMADLGIEASYGVHIRADGYDVYPLAFGPDVFAEWLVIRQAFDINKRAEGDWREPGSGYVGRAIQSGEVA